MNIVQVPKLIVVHHQQSFKLKLHVSTYSKINMFGYVWQS